MLKSAAKSSDLRKRGSRLRHRRKSVLLILLVHPASSFPGKCLPPWRPPPISLLFLAVAPPLRIFLPHPFSLLLHHLPPPSLAAVLFPTSRWPDLKTQEPGEQATRSRRSHPWGVETRASPETSSHVVPREATEQANRLRHPRNPAANGGVRCPLAAPFRGAETNASPETSSKFAPKAEKSKPPNRQTA